MKVLTSTKLLLQWFTIFILSNLTEINCNTSIKQLHILFRHGERAPTETYKNDPYINFTWSGGWGQLTNKGKLEMYSLGMELREIYKDFIPVYYFPEDVEILSSYADRCLMSAESLLAGLFPPKDQQIWNMDLLWQPIPVKYVPRSHDNLIAMKQKCKKYDEELLRIFNFDEMKKIDQENGELYKILSKHTGEKINTIGQVELLYNTLEIETLNNLTLPKWVHQVSLKHLKTLAAKSLATFTHTDYMKRMKGGVFLNKTISDMINKKTPIIHLYAGHDLTLVNILRTLGVVNDQLKPGFGASFIVELHENDVVKMLYRNGMDEKAEELQLTGCNSPCLLENFKDVLKPLLPKNWEEECQ